MTASAHFPRGVVPAVLSPRDVSALLRRLHVLQGHEAELRGALERAYARYDALALHAAAQAEGIGAAAGEAGEKGVTDADRRRDVAHLRLVLGVL